MYLHGFEGAMTWSTLLPDFLAAAITCFLSDGNTLATTIDPLTADAVTPPITPPTPAPLGLTFAGRETGTVPVSCNTLHRCSYDSTLFNHHLFGISLHYYPL